MSNQILNYLKEHGEATHAKISRALKINPDFVMQDLKVLVEDGDVIRSGTKYSIAEHQEEPLKKTGPVEAHAAVTKQASVTRQIDRRSSIEFGLETLEYRLNRKTPALTDKALKLEVLERLAKLMSDDIAEVLMEIGSDLSALPEADNEECEVAA